MKKLSAFVLACALVLTGCSFRVAIDSVDSVLETAPELQRVETVTYLPTRITTEYADGREERQVYDYDNRMYPNSLTYYADGEKTGTDTYTVDEHGNILTITTDYAGGKNRTFAYTYNDAGNILMEECFLKDALDCTTEYTYNESGILTRKVITFADGSRGEYIYDSTGKEQTVTLFDSTGALVSREDHSYDQKTAKETILKYDAAEILLEKRIVTYDAYNQPIIAEVYHADGTLVSTTYRQTAKHTHVDYLEVTEPTA